jgi:hypothetical protein
MGDGEMLRPTFNFLLGCFLFAFKRLQDDSFDLAPRAYLCNDLVVPRLIVGSRSHRKLASRADPFFKFSLRQNLKLHSEDRKCPKCERSLVRRWRCSQQSEIGSDAFL